MKSLFIYGTGGHAKVVADIVRLEGKYDLLGFIDDTSKRGTYLGLPVRSQADFLKKAPSNHASVIVAVGDTDSRKKIATLLKENGFHFGNAIHPNSSIAEDVDIGEGTVVVAGAVVNPGTKIGRHSIINTCASVDHDCLIGDYVHVAPGAVLAGNVAIGSETWIGIGALVRENLMIGERVMVGMGSVVTKHVYSKTVVWGNPAKVQRKND